MEIQQLRHVLAAAQASNYSQAAKKCFTSRQNIAHSVKVIENELDVTMFNREGSEMVLTPEGKRVVRQAGEIIALLKGTTCGGKPTSCPDQLSKALEEALELKKRTA